MFNTCCDEHHSLYQENEKEVIKMTEYKVETKDEFISLVRTEVLTSSEVLEELQISRQALSSLVKRGKLVPVKELTRDKLFLREDIEIRKEASKELFTKYRPYDE